MINVSRLISSRAFTQTLSILRNTGTWMSGRWSQSSSTTLSISGIIDPLTTKELSQLPNFDQLNGGIRAYTLTQLNPTQLSSSESSTGSISDEIIWKGHNWQIVQVDDFSDYGYYKAIAVRKRAT